MTRVIINGVCGRMGSEVAGLLRAGYRDTCLAAAVDKISTDESIYKSLDEFTGEADVIIDFTNHAVTAELTAYALRRAIPLVIATTGQTEAELAIIEAASKKIPIFISANMSVGVALLIKLAVQTAKAFPDADIEIVEKHHNRKLDAPSGTALMIADSIKAVRRNSRYVFGRSGQCKREPEEIGIHALRMGNIVGEHEVIIATDSQTITLKHEVHDRKLLAEGAVAAADFLKGRPAGLYGMKEMLEQQL